MNQRDSSSDPLDNIQSIPKDDNGPVFAEPWQAEVFAMTLTLHERGIFSWKEWATYLSEAIAEAQAAGDPDLGDTYYNHWLAALENLVQHKNIASGEDLSQLYNAWDSAARNTPHGEPIELVQDSSSRDTNS